MLSGETDRHLRFHVIKKIENRIQVFTLQRGLMTSCVSVPKGHFPEGKKENLNSVY